MAPSLGFVSSYPRAQAYVDDLDTATKWWDSYPKRHYTDRTRPVNTFGTYLSNVWSKPKCLARSASFTNLTYIKDTIHDYPIRKSASVSSLAPSLALPQHYREAEKFIPSATVYKPQTYDWYSKSYSRAKWMDLNDELSKPSRRYKYEPLKYSSHVPYYTFQTERIFFNERIQPSYLRGSQNYLDRYVAARLKADDFAQHYTYTAYEWRKPQDHAFNRHFMYGERVFIPHALRMPHSYLEAASLRRLYLLSGRSIFA
ncbi:hypothetical protein AB6A40_007939 [Gnathostoma spinigerum]|uniref:Uncharacterized protein n=1 Tax=Gnathostoma spinigerum TaxID=75299 RepID=A0ABD6EMN8_9BILA